MPLTPEELVEKLDEATRELSHTNDAYGNAHDTAMRLADDLLGHEVRVELRDHAKFERQLRKGGAWGEWYSTRGLYSRNLHGVINEAEIVDGHLILTLAPIRRETNVVGDPAIER